MCVRKKTYWENVEDGVTKAQYIYSVAIHWVPTNLLDEEGKF